ncbi:MAG: peptidoglycan-associated lipoprotein [Candidatus Fischerbacteria bacterium RBG_13_37_8]|uniref:Peptidoglycan-associated lipoprotein n=1 Tax=Candidatus Fischerbacteria bacterium RBG_13_37_8 TaxID=1817863 RepID=A0A1F5VRC5_9BACT|nr:MAG: peptidoglycan-associated lipoprotein [Candidatus Fischerbacteria bacterium RBG_13_37_8]
MKANRMLILLVCLFLACSFACKKKPPVEPVQPPPPIEKVEPVEEVSAPPEERILTEEQIFASTDLEAVTKEFKDVFYDFDKYNVREDQVANLENDAQYLNKWKSVRILIEGHCDERGTNEYNMALGLRRATAARDYLLSLGIDASRIETISYGEERPFATGHDEDSWWQNRRAHFVAIAK